MSSLMIEHVHKMTYDRKSIFLRDKEFKVGKNL